MHRTPSSSERRPLSGLEPTTLAEVCPLASFLSCGCIVVFVN